MLNANPYENFLSFLNLINFSINDSPIISNLKIEIKYFPPISDLILIYEEYFNYKSSPLKNSPKKKWRQEESILFVYVVICYCKMNNKDPENFVF